MLSCGLGAALGELILEHGGPGLESSVLVAARRREVPLTVHVAVGTDIVHMTPRLDGASLGKATLHDFRTLCEMVAGMSGGVWINLGSAVVLPEVFLKAVAVAQPRPTARWADHRQPRLRSEISRPAQRLAAPGAEGIALTGHHELMIPLLHAAVAATRNGKP